MQSRWLIFPVGMVLYLVALFQGKIESALIAFLMGMGIGFVIDWVGIKLLKFWVYPRQPFPSIQYFALALPGWGIFGASANWLCTLITPVWLGFFLATIILLAICELLNLRTRTWKYMAPTWMVVTGWIPLILVFRITFLAVR